MVQNQLGIINQLKITDFVDLFIYVVVSVIRLMAFKRVHYILMKLSHKLNTSWD